MLKLTIMGVGCSKHKKLSKLTKQAAEDLGLEYSITHARNLTVIMRAGVKLTPALLIEGSIKSQGKVPTLDEIKEFLTISEKTKYEKAL